MVEENLFREDLYHRLVVWPVNLPPLRAWSVKDRKKLVRIKWREISEELGKRLGHNSRVKGLPDEVIHILIQQPWHGNVRQLDSALKRLYVLSGRGKVTQDLLDEALITQIPIRALPGEAFDMEERLNKIKDQWILAAYKQEGTWKKAAAYLDMPESTLNTYRKTRNL